MIYYGTEHNETIVFHREGDTDDMHYITMSKSLDAPTFIVKCCCDPKWNYQFYMENNSDYERVKLFIMETLFYCKSMNEVMEELGSIFTDCFDDILVNDDECDGNCEHCDEHKYMN